MKSIRAFGAAMALLASMATAQSHEAPAKATAQSDAEVIATQLPSYPSNICPVSDESLVGMEDVQNVVVEGRLVRVCCKGCVKKVKATPMQFIEGVNAAVIKQQAPHYPMTTCPISGQELGSMGDPIQLVHGTRLVKLCCKGCVKGFHKDPSKTMAMLDAALIEQQLKTYKLNTCLVSGEALEDGKAVNFLYGTQLIRVCCKGCIKGVKENPGKYVAMLRGEGKGHGEGKEKQHGHKEGKGHEEGKGHGKL